MHAAHAARVTRVTRVTRLTQECSPLWAEIVEGTHDWERDAHVATAARRLEAADLLELFDAHFAAGAPLRRAVISHAFSQADARADDGARCEPPAE